MLKIRKTKRKVVVEISRLADEPEPTVLKRHGPRYALQRLLCGYDPLSRDDGASQGCQFSFTLCDYNSETTSSHNLVLRAEEKKHVSGTE
jgi:hypothetical protein